MKKSVKKRYNLFEILSFFVLMCVLGTGVVIGYEQLMRYRQSRLLIDSAEKYADIIFVGKDTWRNSAGKKQIPSADELILNPLHMGIHVTQNYSYDRGIELQLTFFDKDLCQNAAALVHESCILSPDDCRSQPTGLSADKLNRVVGCFNHIFWIR